MLGPGSPQPQVQGKLILDGQRFWVVKPNLKRGYRHDKRGYRLEQYGARIPGFEYITKMPHRPDACRHHPLCS